MKRTVFFEFYNKRMKVTVDANSDDKAIAMVRNRINVIKVETDNDSVVDDLMNMFNMKK
jgi:hypothetical protein